MDFTDQTFLANPHPVYEDWRATGPVRREHLPGGAYPWLITRYEDARLALSDPRLSKTLPGNYVGVFTAHMLNADPPDHTRLRRLVSAAFTARRIEGLRPRIEQITDDLLAGMAGRERLDLIDAFAFPLPIQVICELLGVPADDRDAFRTWSNSLIDGSGDHESAVLAMAGYIGGLIAERRARPGDDLLSGLIEVGAQSDRLSERELTAMVFLLLIAGHETTVNLIGNGVYLLLSEPERWDRLRADPALLPSAIEEFLRYEGPVETSTYRFATEDVEIGGTVIPAGDPVLVVLLSANRDAARFPDAAELRLDRPQNPHLAFGHGIHYCLGAPLARLEAQVAFAKLMAGFPGLRLAVKPDELRWRPGTLIRGLEHLPVLTR